MIFICNKKDVAYLKTYISSLFFFHVWSLLILDVSPL